MWDPSAHYTVVLIIFDLICGLICSWEGKGDTEIGKDKASGKILVRVDPKFYRPTEVVRALLIIILNLHINIFLNLLDENYCIQILF